MTSLKDSSHSGESDRCASQENRLDAAFESYRIAWFSGKHLDIDRFCEEHPECGPALRQKLQDFQFVVEGLPEPEDALVDCEEEKDGETLQGRTLGDFHLLREIGRGGMGVVYAAEQISLRRMVALKVLPAHLSFSADVVRKFKREAEAGGRQSHPAIVAIFAVGKYDGIHYIAQELVDAGRTLGDYLESLKSSGPLPAGYFRKTARLVARIAEALQHAHDSGVIHRDIKPTNILLTAKGNPKVTDFGLAKVEDALALSRTGDFAGTPYYMSPEQAASRRIGIDHRTDIFSLGVTLYEMLSLNRPFDGESSQEVLKKILLHEPKDPRKVNPRVPRDLAVICLKALEKKPEARYASMRAFADDLHRYLSGDVIKARPSGPITRTVKLVHRHSRLAAACLGVLLCLTVFGIHLLFQEFKAYRQNQINERIFASVLSEAEASLEKGLDVQGEIEKLRELKSNDPGIKVLESKAREASNKRHEQALAQIEKEFQKASAVNLSLLAQFLSSSNPGLALALALNASAIDENETINSRLVEIMSHCRERKTHLTGHPIHDADFHSDSNLGVTAFSHTVFIWDITTNKIKNRYTHENRVNSVCISHDGRWIASGSQDGSLFLWSVDENRIVHRLKHDGAVNSVVFSPTDRSVLSASSDLTAKVFDVQTGKEVTVLTGFGWLLNQAVFSGDGALIATASEDGMVRVWDANTLEILNTWSIPDFEPTAIGFSPQSQGTSLLAVGLQDGTVCIGPWNELEFESYPLHEKRVNSIEFDPTGNFLITASDDHTACLWNVTRKWEVAYLVRHEEDVTRAGFCHQGSRVFTASLDSGLRFWNVYVSGKISDLEIPRGWTPVLLSDNGGFILCLDRAQRNITIWDIETERECFTLSEQKEKIKRWAISPDGNRLALSLQGLHLIRVWDLTTKTMIREGQHGNDINHLDFSPDGTKVVSGSSDGFALILDLENGVKNIKLPHGNERVFGANFSADGKRLITHTNKGTARIWNVMDGQLIGTIADDNHPIRYAFLDPAGTTAVTTSFGAQVRIWKAGLPGAGTILGEPLRRNVYADFTPDGTSILVISMLEVGNDNQWKLLLFDAQSLEETAEFDCEKTPLCFPIFSHDSRWFMTYFEDHKLRIWDCKEKRPHLTISVDLPNNPNNLFQFTSNDSHVVTCSKDRRCESRPANPRKLTESCDIRPLTLKEKKLHAIWSSEEMEVLPLVGEVFGNHLLKGEALKAIQGSSEITPAKKKTSLILAEAMDVDRGWEEDASILNRQSRIYSEKIDLDSTSCERAHAYTAEACRREPDNRAYKVSLGLTQYHLGEYAKAIDTLQKVKDSHELIDRDRLICTAFLAMSYHCAGQEQAAHESLDALRAMAKENRFQGIMEGWYYLDHVEAMLAGSWPIPIENPPPMENYPLSSMEPLLFILEEESKQRFLMQWDPSGGLGETEARKIKVLDEGERFLFIPSPDGMEAVHLRQDNDGRYAMAVTSLKPGGESRVILDYTPYPLSISCWHPDGTKIYFGKPHYESPPTGADICWTDAEGIGKNNYSKLLFNLGQVKDCLTCAPDASWVVFMHAPYHSNGFLQEIWRAKLSDDGKRLWAPKPLTKNRNNESRLCISSDGNYIYWIEQTQENRRYIMRMQSNGTEKRVLYGLGVNDNIISGLSLSKQGYMAVLKQCNKQSVIILLDPYGRELGRLDWGNNNFRSQCFLPVR